MIAAKKIEVVIESINTKKVIVIFKKLKIEGYTVLQEATGAGAHGKYDAQELTDVFKNTYFIVVCSQEQMQTLIHELRPIVKKYGGICYISDVQRINS